VIKKIKMKKKFPVIVTISLLACMACNQSGSKNETAKHDVNKMDTASHAEIADDKEVKTVAVTFTHPDAKAAASINEIIGHYLHIKNALVKDNGNDAAAGANAMQAAIGKLDKSLLSAEQKKVYNDMEDDLKEHAEHIGKNGGNLAHQREHFSLLCEVVYDLVKAFGGGRALYHDHCPMYNKDKGGAMWLSEIKEIGNPYFGADMPTCGTMEELIK
jgi:K+ transporter